MRILSIAALAALSLLAIPSPELRAQVGVDVVHPGQLQSGKTTMRMFRGKVDREGGAYRFVPRSGVAAVSIEISGLSVPTLVTCSVGEQANPPPGIAALHAGSSKEITIKEWIAVGNEFALTSNVETHPLSAGSVQIVALPDPSGTYMYRITGGNSAWELHSCTVEDL
ncbi:MAG: hypothetical protein AAF721_27960 [Myxococcota bacterium]